MWERSFRPEHCRMGVRAHVDYYAFQFALETRLCRRHFRRCRQAAVQLCPGFADAEQQLDELPQNPLILLDLGLHHLAAQHGVEAGHLRRQLPALVHVERSLELLQRQEGVLEFRAAAFDVASSPWPRWHS